MQVRCDGPSVQECVGGPTVETDLGAISPSEVVVDVNEVQQGDYVRVTLRFENTKRKIGADKILRIGMNTDVSSGAAKSFWDFCFLHMAATKVRLFLLSSISTIIFDPYSQFPLT